MHRYRDVARGSTDAEVIRSSLRHPSAFDSLFERHFDIVRRYAQRRCGLTAGEDVAAATFEQAFSSRSRYDLDRPNAIPWLLGIASHLVGRWAREERMRFAAYERMTEAVSTLGPTPDAYESALEMGSAIRLVRSLDPVDRHVLLLHVWAELSYEQIAESLELPIGTVRS